MAMKKCPKCGELYSDSYTTCPYCVDDEEIRSIARASMQPRRVLIGVVCLLLVLCGATYYFFGGALRSALAPRMPAPSSPLTDEIPMPEGAEETIGEIGEITGDQETAAVYEVKVGEGLQMGLNTNEECTWTSSDSTVASINENGLLTALKAGTVTVTANLADGKQVECTVTVIEPEPAAPASTAGTTETETGAAGNSGSTGTAGTGSSNSGTASTGSSTGSTGTSSSSSGSSNSGSTGTAAGSETNGGELNYGDNTAGNAGNNNNGIYQQTESGFVITSGGGNSGSSAGSEPSGFVIEQNQTTVQDSGVQGFVIN